MPISDGYETVKKIQNLFEESLIKKNGVSISLYRPYIIAASSFISDSVKEKTKAAGFDASYSIPITTSQI